mgnify:CR=1 FL=1
MKIVDHDSYYQFNFPNQEGFPLNLKEQVHIVRDILLREIQTLRNLYININS